MGYQDQPLTSKRVAQLGVADEFGNLLVSQAVDAPATAIDPRITDFILYGVINGAFARGPQDPNGNIGPENNPLPDWTGPVIAAGAGGPTAQWVNVGSASPSGQALQFTFGQDGLGTDDMYFEQIVPAGGSGMRTLSNLVRTQVVGTAGADTLNAYVNLTYLDAAGSTVGASTEYTVGVTNGFTGSLYGTIRDTTVHIMPTANATQLRIRIGARRFIGNGPVTFYVTDLRNDHAFGAVLLGEQDSPGSFGPGRIIQQGGILSLRPDNGGASLQQGIALNRNGQTSLYGVPLFPTVIAPVLASSPNNWAPAGIATSGVVTVDMGAANRTITGISATGFVEGQTFWLFVYNAVGFTLSLTHNDALSTAGNRFSCPAGATQTVRNNAGVQIMYLPTKFANAPFQVEAP